MNPIQTAALRHTNIRKTKTDTVDAVLVARTLMTQPHRFLTYRNLDLMHLKNFGRFRQNLIKQRTRLKIQLTSYLDQVFQERACYKIENSGTEVCRDYRPFFILTNNSIH
jgi:transposase